MNRAVILVVGENGSERAVVANHLAANLAITPLNVGQQVMREALESVFGTRLDLVVDGVESYDEVSLFHQMGAAIVGIQGSVELCDENSALPVAPSVIDIASRNESTEKRGSRRGFLIDGSLPLPDMLLQVEAIAPSIKSTMHIGSTDF